MKNATTLPWPQVWHWQNKRLLLNAWPGFIVHIYTIIKKKEKEKEKSYFSFLATKAPANHLFSSELKPLIPFGQRTTQRTLRGHGAPGHLGNGAGKGKGLPFATFCCGWTHRAAGNLLAPCCFAKLATYLGCYEFRETRDRGCFWRK